MLFHLSIFPHSQNLAWLPKISLNSVSVSEVSMDNSQYGLNSPIILYHMLRQLYSFE